MLRFICTFIVGVNILTLCYAATEEPVFKHHNRRDVPAMHVPVANPETPKPQNNPPPVAVEEKPLVINTNGLVKLKDLGVNKTVVDVASEKPQINHVEAPKENVTAQSEIAGVVHVSGNVPGAFDTGSLKRASLVFLLLCVIILACYAWKTYRLRKASSAPLMVHKYGVRANRSDIEMRPLPLDEDEDDDTLFEIGNNTNQQ